MATYVNHEGFLAENDYAAEDFASGEPFEIFKEFFQRKKEKP
ncbi:MAG: hypothetical protein R6U96_02735 [Promethearchaeia archaeon]